MQHLKSGIKTVRQKCVFSSDEEEELKSCIAGLAELDFAMTLNDIAELVESYVAVNDYERCQIFLKHKGRPGFLCLDWMSLFFKKKGIFL